MKKGRNNIRKWEELCKVGDRREHLGRVARTAWISNPIIPSDAVYMSWDDLTEKQKERYSRMADEVIKASRKPIKKRTFKERLLDAGIITKDGKLSPHYQRGKNVRDSKKRVPDKE